jgi:hypothetical protein
VTGIATRFVYEIGISRDGTHVTAPGNSRIVVAASAVPEINKRDASGVVKK